jgi:hypothetical protein
MIRDPVSGEVMIDPSWGRSAEAASESAHGRSISAQGPVPSSSCVMDWIVDKKQPGAMDRAFMGWEKTIIKGKQPS